MRTEAGIRLLDESPARWGNLIDPRPVLVRDLHVQRAEVVVQLFYRTRADNRAGNRRLLYVSKPGPTGLSYNPSP